MDASDGSYTFEVKGDGAFSVFKFEGGTHRVQRVPETESQGRIHTSTATVAVLPEAEDVDVEIDQNDLQVDVYRSSGPGVPPPGITAVKSVLALLSAIFAQVPQVGSAFAMKYGGVELNTMVYRFANSATAVAKWFAGCSGIDRSGSELRTPRRRLEASEADRRPRHQAARQTDHGG